MKTCLFNHTRYQVKLLSLFGLFVITAASSASAATPLIIQYEGRVTVDGTAFTGPGFFKFALVDGGTILWDNDPGDGSTQLPGNGTVAPVEAEVTQGRFSVPLGDTSLANMEALDPTDFLDHDNIVLRVWFSADNIVFNELTPAQRLTAVPYALVSRIAETVADRAVGSAQIQDGAVTSAQIAGGTVGSTELTDDDIALNDLSSDVLMALVPTGTVVPFAGSSPPAGWVLCDGTLYDADNQLYANLGAVLGTTYGSASGNRFRVPDLRSRTVVGTGDGGSGLSNRTRGQKFGAETHSLSKSQMPRHSHGINDPGHEHTFNAARQVVGGDTDNDDPDGGSKDFSGRATSKELTKITIKYEGGDGSGEEEEFGLPHNNMQPSLALNYIIKL